VVTGYGPGERNPFTGYYEVRNSDAHAWVEVFYPSYGWVPYDPTFGVPAAPDAWGSPVGAELAAWMADQVARVVPADVRARVGGITRGALALARDAAAAWPVLLVLTVTVVAVWLRRRRRRTRVVPLDAIDSAYLELLAALAAAGHEPDRAKTPSEVRAEVIDDPRLAGEAAGHATLVLDTLERARFARPVDRPGDVDVMRAVAAATRVRELTRRP
jgi:hypothetical protein